MVRLCLISGNFFNPGEQSAFWWRSYVGVSKRIMYVDGYLIRKAARHEVDLIISWANCEGWNPGIHDAETFYTTDSNGFLVGIFEGKPVASISAVAYGDSFGFMGFYMVRPSFRGRGSA
jgi:hypothetical protein